MTWDHEENNRYTPPYISKNKQKEVPHFIFISANWCTKEGPIDTIDNETLINWYKIIVFVCVKQAGNLYYVLVHITILYSFMSFFFYDLLV